MFSKPVVDIFNLEDCLGVICFPWISKLSWLLWIVCAETGKEDREIGLKGFLLRDNTTDDVKDLKL